MASNTGNEQSSASRLFLTDEEHQRLMTGALLLRLTSIETRPTTERSTAWIDNASSPSVTKYLEAFTTLLVRENERVALLPSDSGGAELRIVFGYSQVTEDGRNVVKRKVANEEVEHLVVEENKNLVSTSELAPEDAKAFVSSCTYDGDHDRWVTSNTFDRHSQTVLGLLKEQRSAMNLSELSASTFRFRRYISLTCSSKMRQRLDYGEIIVPELDKSIFSVLTFSVLTEEPGPSHAAMEAHTEDLTTWPFAALAATQQEFIRQLMMFWRTSGLVDPDMIDAIDPDRNDRARPFYDAYGRARFQIILACTLAMTKTTLTQLNNEKGALLMASKSTQPNKAALVAEHSARVNVAVDRAANSVKCVHHLIHLFSDVFHQHLRWLHTVHAEAAQSSSRRRRGNRTQESPNGNSLAVINHARWEIVHLLQTPQGWHEAAMRYLELICAHYTAIATLKPQGFDLRENIKGVWANRAKIRTFEMRRMSREDNVERMQPIEKFLNTLDISFDNRVARRLSVETREKISRVIRRRLKVQDLTPDSLEECEELEGGCDPETLLLSLHMLAHLRAHGPQTVAAAAAQEQVTLPPEHIVKMFLKGFPVLATSDFIHPVAVKLATCGGFPASRRPIYNGSHSLWPGTGVPRWLPRIYAAGVEAAIMRELKMRFAGLDEHVLATSRAADLLTFEGPEGA